MSRRDDSFTFSGPDAARTVSMINGMTEFLAGPGLDGFVAWLDQKAAEAGIPGGVKREHARALLAQLNALTGGAWRK